MPIRTAFLVSSLCCALAFLPSLARSETPSETAQPKAAAESAAKLRTVIKQLRYIEPAGLVDVLGLFDVEVAIKPEMSAVVLRGPSDDLDVAIKVIENLDRPPLASSTIELTVHVLAASEQPIAGSRLPGELRPIVDQLRELFGYSGFELLESTFLRSTDGGHGNIIGGLKAADDKIARYTMSFDRVKTIERQDDAPPILRFSSFNFTYQQDSHSASLNTDFEMPVDRRVVLGRATPSGLSQALILIAEAKVSNGT